MIARQKGAATALFCWMSRRLLIALLTLAALVLPAGSASAVCTTWKQTGSDTFRWHDTLMRSQGVTSDGHGWLFSWQGGLSRTLDDYTPTAIATLPPQAGDPPTLSPNGGSSASLRAGR